MNISYLMDGNPGVQDHEVCVRRCQLECKHESPAALGEVHNEAAGVGGWDLGL